MDNHTSHKLKDVANSACLEKMSNKSGRFQGRKLPLYGGWMGKQTDRSMPGTINQNYGEALVDSSVIDVAFKATSWPGKLRRSLDSADHSAL
jgi:hypothetical protein